MVNIPDIQRRVEQQRPPEPDRQRQVNNSYANAKAEVREAIMGKLRENDCKGALDIALIGSDIELATQVKAYCAIPNPR